VSNKKPVPDNFLIGYFSEDDILQFKEILEEFAPLDKTGLEKISEINRKQLKGEITQRDNLLLNIDLLITFAQRKLTENKFVEFLLHLGEISISRGELQSASSVYENILNQIKNESKLENVAAHSLLALGNIYSRHAQWEKSLTYIKKAKKIFEKQKDYQDTAKCENLLGTIAGDRSHLRKANSHFERSLSLLNPQKDNSLVGMLEINLGILNTIQGNFDIAFTYFQRALIIYEQLKDFKRIAEIRHNLGVLFTQKNEVDEALVEFDISLEHAAFINYLPSLAVSYLSKAYLYTRNKDFILANAFAGKALEVCIKLNDRLSIADIYKIKGIIERNLKNYPAAENFLLTSIRMNKELENEQNAAESSYELGVLYLEIKKEIEALTYLNASYYYFKKVNVPQMLTKIERLTKNI